MEATDTIDSAIDKIIAPAPEETGETNQVEEETSVAPEAEEAELEAVEETEELDELEVSEEDIEKRYNKTIDEAMVNNYPIERYEERLKSEKDDAAKILSERITRV